MGFGLSHKLKTKQYFMYATLHGISLALILYQAQQMFKCKRNKNPHNSHKIIFIVSGRQAIYSGEITVRSTSIYSFTLLACGLWNNFSAGNPVIRMASAFLLWFTSFVVILAYLIWTTVSVYCLHIGAIFSAAHKHFSIQGMVGVCIQFSLWCLVGLLFYEYRWWG